MTMRPNLARILTLLSACGLFLPLPCAFGNALDDLHNAAPGVTPNVPMPGNPTLEPMPGSSDGSNNANAAEAAEARAAAAEARAEAKAAAARAAQWRRDEAKRKQAEQAMHDAAFSDAKVAALNLMGNRPGVPDPAANFSHAEESVFGPGGTVVDLQNLRRSAYFARTVEKASTEDVSLLLDEAIKSANGVPSSLGGIPAKTVLPEIDASGLLAFQQANIDYARSHDAVAKCREDITVLQQRLALAYQDAKRRISEVEWSMANKTDAASIQKKQEMLAEIYSSVQDEEEALLAAKARMAAAQDQIYKTREESVRVLRALSLGKSPADFHPPIASLPAVTEETLGTIQKHLLDERAQLEASTQKLQRQLGSYVPPLQDRERVHEGVIMGFRTDASDATNMQEDGTSCFTGKKFSEMNAVARQTGHRLGGALVVSFGTPKNTDGYGLNEGGRIVGDHLTAGEVSLSTPQAQKAINDLAGKEFDRLVAHSNGASVAEALIKNDIITVNELNIMGGDRSMANGHELQQLLDSGKVKRVVVWINANDPVPGATSLLDQLKPMDRCQDAAMHLARKITGDLAAGDARVEYRFMKGEDYRNPNVPKDVTDAPFADHFLESSYYPGAAKELGVDYKVSKRVFDAK